MDGNLAYDLRQDWSHEVIDGEIHMMAPASSRHNTIAGNVYALLWNFLRGKPCQAFIEGPEVHLSGKDYYIPDVSVVCDHTKLRHDRIFGPPDLVVEILSPSTKNHDRGRKKKMYERSGVREYWIIDPGLFAVEQYVLRDGRLMLKGIYIAGQGGVDTFLTSGIFPNLTLSLRDIFFESKGKEFMDENTGKEQEIFGGEIHPRPLPSERHSAVVGNLCSLLKRGLGENACRIFANGPEIYFQDREILIADVCVLCDGNQYRADRIWGAPDLVAEVLSDSTLFYDRGPKMEIYGRFGVREYWLADIRNRAIEQYVLEEGRLQFRIACEWVAPETLEYMYPEQRSQIFRSFSSAVFPELTVSVEKVFENISEEPLFPLV